MDRVLRFSTASLLALAASTSALGQAVVLDFNGLSHATGGFQAAGSSPTYAEDSFQIELMGAGSLGSWGTASSNFLSNPTLLAGSSGTWLEMTHASGNLFSVESIDVIDFLSSQASANAAGGNQVTFHGTQADSTVLSSTFTFATAAYDREVFSFGSVFTNLTSFAWNQNSANVPVAGTSANRAHQVDNIAATILGPVPALPPTIVALGDSTTNSRNVGSANSGRPVGFSTSGINSSDGSNPPHNIVNTVTQSSGQLYVYSDQLRDQLSAASFAFEAVDNEGIGSNKTNQGLSRLNSDVIAKDPDIVIIQFGINDSWIDNASVAETAVFDPTDGDDGNSRIDVSDYRDNLDAMVETLTDDGVTVILMSPNVQGSNHETPGSLNPNHRNIRMEQFVFAMEDVFAEAVVEGRDVEYIDVWQLYEDHAASGGDVDDWLLDGQHPNALGHEVVADELFALISVPEPTSLGIFAVAGVALLRRRRP